MAKALNIDSNTNPSNINPTKDEPTQLSLPFEIHDGDFVRLRDENNRVTFGKVLAVKRENDGIGVPVDGNILYVTVVYMDDKFDKQLVHRFPKDLSLL